LTEKKVVNYNPEVKKGILLTTLLFRYSFNYNFSEYEEERDMKKIVLALTTTLLLPNMSYAAACADGANVCA
jgi:hypothetical protein